MSAVTQALTVEQGSNFKWQVLWKNASAVAIDMTGYTVKMQVRETATSTTVKLSATSVASAGITLTPLTGTMDINIPAAETALVRAGEYVYDLVAIDPAGTIYRLAMGTATVSAGVTR